MACNGRASILQELTDLVNDVGNGCEPTDPCSCCPPPCCQVPCNFPYAEVTMTCPPPILAPTRPQPVKPLMIRCPSPPEPMMITQEERDILRYDNFYNNYNMDWHPESPRYRNKDRPWCTPAKQRGQTVDGKSPCCDEISQDDCCNEEGCPTGFKPCTMKLTPPPGCHPCGVWCAQVQPCPPKPRKTNQFQPGEGCGD